MPYNWREKERKEDISVEVAHVEVAHTIRLTPPTGKCIKYARRERQHNMSQVLPIPANQGRRHIHYEIVSAHRNLRWRRDAVAWICR